METMKRVRLQSKTLHARNKIVRHGNIWMVLDENQNSIHVRSIDKSYNLYGQFFHYSCCVMKEDDHDFDILEYMD